MRAKRDDLVPLGWPPVGAKVDAEVVIFGDAQLNKGGVGRSWSKHRGAVVLEPFWTHLLPGNREQQRGIVYREVLEHAGIMRWLITLLGTINAVPKEMKQAQTRQGKRQVGANILPYFQHRTISIRVPRDNHVQWVRRHVQTTFRNQPRPWHSVKGHWRIVEPGKAAVCGRLRGRTFCRHEPTMVERDHAMCSRCEMIIKWIKNHNRGDPNVGIVSHTYKVST
jgi:hypothetical protein